MEELQELEADLPGYPGFVQNFTNHPCLTVEFEERGGRGESTRRFAVDNPDPEVIELALREFFATGGVK